MTADEPTVRGTVHEPTVILRRDRLTLPGNSRIDSFCLVNATGEVTIGEQSCIHCWSGVVGSGGLTMGDRAVITYGARLITSTADLRYTASSVVPRSERRAHRERIVLEDETFVGTGAVVMPGVTVERAGVVAAGAYVDSDVPAGTIRYSDGSEAPRPGDW